MQKTETRPPIPLRPSARRVRSLGFTAMTVALIVGVVLAGFQHFVLTLPKPASGKLQFTDGIVVMTGGQQRLSDGIRLLSDGLADKLLISGVGQGVSRAILAKELRLDDAQTDALFCCVELDHIAQDTRGNAAVAKQWAQTHGMTSLRLVTANYHMPRTLLIFQREMPEITLYQWPTSPEDLDLDKWWQNAASLRLLAREYAKYLTVYFGM